MDHQTPFLGALAGALLVLTPGLMQAQEAGDPSRDFTLTPPPREIIQQDAGDLVDTGEIVVLVPDAAAADRLTNAADGAGYSLLRRDGLDGIGLVMLTFELPDGIGPLEAIGALEALEPGTTAGVNHAYRSGEVATGTTRSYADELIQWPEGGCRAQAPVGVIDTGLQAEAKPLAGATVTQADFTGNASSPGHGTAVAELLIGPGRLMDAQIFHAAVVEEVPGRPPAAGVDAILLALDWLQTEGVQLANVSLAGPYNKILDRGMQTAAKRGMVIVAAAGNTGPGSAPRYPAAFEYTIAVTAVDAASRAYASAADGAHIDVAAPGVDLFVHSVGDGRYMSGTSLAAPFVTAAIAANPDTASLGSADDLRAWLAGSSKDLGDPGPDPLFGTGLLQVRC